MGCIKHFTSDLRGIHTPDIGAEVAFFWMPAGDLSTYLHMFLLTVLYIQLLSAECSLFPNAGHDENCRLLLAFFWLAALSDGDTCSTYNLHLQNKTHARTHTQAHAHIYTQETRAQKIRINAPNRNI